MSAPQVSVLMTVFNTERFAQEAIDSILSQTFGSLELIIIDDGSSDGSWRIVETNAARDSRIVAWRCARRRGASGALNEGLTRARGEYITRQDSDDRSLPTRLASQVAFLQRNAHIGAVGTDVAVIDTEGTSTGMIHFPEHDDEIQRTLLDKMCFCGPTVLARKSAFQKAGFAFDEEASGSEDYDLCLRLAEVTKVANLNEALYLYRRHPSSVSQSQRHHQLYVKAAALEKAIHRRFGPTPSPARFANAARDYLRAAVVAHAARDAALVRESLRKAISLDSALPRRTELIETVVRRYTPSTSIATALEFTASVFDVLPRTRALAGVKRRLVAELHIKEAVAETGGQPSSVAHHLWRAIRSNPACVTKREILALLVKRGVAAWGLFPQAD